jgi:hypothetical protein
MNAYLTKAQTTPVASLIEKSLPNGEGLFYGTAVLCIQVKIIYVFNRNLVLPSIYETLRRTLFAPECFSHSSGNKMLLHALWSVILLFH